MTSLNTLADELLLQIGHNIRDRRRNLDLSNFSLVSHRLRNIGQECLLSQPTLNILHVPKLMLELWRRPWILPQIRRLKLWSRSKGRNYAALPEHLLDLGSLRIFYLTSKAQDTWREHERRPCPAHIINMAEFMQFCFKTIDKVATDEKKAAMWVIALEKDAVPALLAILLSALPNLEELRCTSSWIMDSQLFNALKYRKESIVTTSDLDADYLQDVVSLLKPRLQVLEFPTDFRGAVFNPKPYPMFDFRSFKLIKELSVSMTVLDYGATHPRTRLRGLADPVMVLPSSLEILRISEATGTTANFINDLCLAKKKFRFRSLRRIELFFLNTKDIITEDASALLSPTPATEIPKMCKDTNIELLMHFPATKMKVRSLGQSPWVLRDEGLLVQAQEQLFFRRQLRSLKLLPSWSDAIDVEFDAEGDINMENCF